MRRPRWTKSETSAGQAAECFFTVRILTVLLPPCAEGRALRGSGRAGAGVRPLLLACARLHPRLGHGPALQPLDLRAGVAPPRRRRRARPLLRRVLVGTA